MVTKEVKEKILTAMKARRSNYSSDNKFAIMLGINSSQYNRIKNGELERVISDANWISIARKLEVTLTDLPVWQVAKTPVYDYVNAQLEICQKNSSSLLLCDYSDIGKSFIAKHYCKTHQNAIYIDCSQTKSKYKLVRKIGKEFGVGQKGTYTEVYEDLTYYLRSLEEPLIILDEAGDLEYSAFLELKALWNATEHYCGWYMMGADVLQRKIMRGIAYQKVGYPEIFTRYGSDCCRVMAQTEKELKRERDLIVAIIAKANAEPEWEIGELVRIANGSPRRLYKEIMKRRAMSMN
ncbi:MAG: AAA family ATPase [Bacteroidales bacterium]|jgi:DNA transposition AAA+ family ATPase|nr:AAA family ATPase [Bacteroidales bacterium]